MITHDTIITIIASVVTSGITAFAIIAHRTGRYSEKIDQLEKCNLNTRLSVLEGKVESTQPLTKRKSPISLTDRGSKVLTESGGKSFIDNNYLELKEKVELSNPKTSYDIQESSKEVVSSLKDDDRINTIKEYLFKEGLELDNLVEVLGIYLRDLILKEKNIDISDLDKYL